MEGCGYEPRGWTSLTRGRSTQRMEREKRMMIKDNRNKKAFFTHYYHGCIHLCPWLLVPLLLLVLLLPFSFFLSLKHISLSFFILFLFLHSQTLAGKKGEGCRWLVSWRRMCPRPSCGYNLTPAMFPTTLLGLSTLPQGNCCRCLAHLSVFIAALWRGWRRHRSQWRRWQSWPSHHNNGTHIASQ